MPSCRIWQLSFILVLMRVLLSIYFFVIGLCFGSFALATAWRIKKKKGFGRERSECEKCHHALAGKDLVPLFSWLSLRGRCRYCHKKLSGWLPIAELAGAVAFAGSYMAWQAPLHGFLTIARFVVWCMALVLLLILFFYDLQWYILPNKIVHPLWVISLFDFVLRFAQRPRLATLLYGMLAIIVGAGLFLLFYVVSKGTWIGFGDVRLGVAIGLLAGTPIMAAMVIFAASVIGVLVALPSLVTHQRKLSSKLPFGPLLILALVLVQLFGQKTLDWYSAHLLFI